jgi:hypothetical protein
VPDEDETMSKKRAAPVPEGPFVVVSGTSTRRSSHRGTKAFDEWIHYQPGDLVTEWPEHAPVGEWLASGHWKEAEA